KPKIFVNTKLKRKQDQEALKRNKKKRPLAEQDEVIRLPNPMIGFGVPSISSVVTYRTLPKAAIGHYYRKVVEQNKPTIDRSRQGIHISKAMNRHISFQLQRSNTLRVLYYHDINSPTSGLPQFDGMWRETLLTTRSVLVDKDSTKELREAMSSRPKLCLPPKGDDEAAPKAGLEVAPKAGVELPKAGDNNFWLSYPETTLKCVELTEIL
ncbi:hypothetical protein Tco_1435635, partial [Tanacetum coccineum]